MRDARFLLLISALEFACPVAATDLNLLPNGDFTQPNQLTNWSCLGGTWSSDDADSSAGSGSMWLQNTGNIAGSCTSACFAVRAGAAYSLGGQSRTLLGSSLVASFACASSSATQCTSFTYDLQGPAMSLGNSWGAATSAEGFLASGVQSMKCTVTLGSQDLGSASGRFDNLFFRTDVILFNGFDSP